MTKILLLGKNGQVGFELARSLQPLGKVIALDRATGGDVTDFAQMTQAFATHHPHFVVNATAYTAVDKAESDQQTADLVNHLAVAHLAQLAKTHGSVLIHYSTDYVFDGTGGQFWAENSPTHPVNHYGATKRAGELALETSGADFINLRTSWVFGTHGNNFLKTILKLAKDKKTLGIIHDQVGSPTPAHLIADVTAQIIRQIQLSPDVQAFGDYHLAADGLCSWYEYADFIFKEARTLGMTLAVEEVNAITTADYPTPAKRPHNSRLDTHKLKSTFGLTLPHWQHGVAYVLKELIHDRG